MKARHSTITYGGAFLSAIKRVLDKEEPEYRS